MESADRDRRHRLLHEIRALEGICKAVYAQLHKGQGTDRLGQDEFDALRDQYEQAQTDLKARREELAELALWGDP